MKVHIPNNVSLYKNETPASIPAHIIGLMRPPTSPPNVSRQ